MAAIFEPLRFRVHITNVRLPGVSVKQYDAAMRLRTTAELPNHWLKLEGICRAESAPPPAGFSRSTAWARSDYALAIEAQSNRVGFKNVVFGPVRSAPSWSVLHFS